MEKIFLLSDLLYLAGFISILTGMLMRNIVCKSLEVRRLKMKWSAFTIKTRNINFENLESWQWIRKIDYMVSTIILLEGMITAIVLYLTIIVIIFAGINIGLTWTIIGGIVTHNWLPAIINTGLVVVGIFAHYIKEKMKTK